MNFLFDHWTLFASILGGVIAIMIALKYRIPSLEKDLGKILERIGDLEKGKAANDVFHKDLVTFDKCSDIQSDCRSVLCAKLNALDNKLATVSSLRETTIAISKDVEHMREEIKNLVQRAEERELSYAGRIRDIVSGALLELLRREGIFARRIDQP